MRTYEAMCVFRSEDEIFSRGKDVVREELVKLDGKIVKEEDMGQRSLAYPIKKANQAHYYYFVVEMGPDKAHQIEQALKLKTELLRFLMVRRDS
ncbi:30S ribosomal protein S6 [Salinispira pacifica]